MSVTKKRYWKSKKYKKEFQGFYERDNWGERIFVLLGVGNNNRQKRIVFESWQAAKSAGWELK
jgi:hypothetical protein